MDYVIYIASAVGALAVYMMMPAQRSTPKRVGALLGLLALGAVLVALIDQTPRDMLPSVYYYVFTVIAGVCAVRVITHPRPVYSALFFVMVVLAVAGLFLILEAEFVAFGMIIIYAGAILVTYLFVIMLATLPQVEGQEEQSPLYDRVAREPFSAVVMGFALLAVLTSVMFRGEDVQPTELFADAPAHVTLVNDMPRRAIGVLEDLGVVPDGVDLAKSRLSVQGNDLILANDDKPSIAVPLTEEMRAALGGQLGNIDRVGLALFKGHALGIELAGIILLLSMVGAIVIGRKNVLVELDANGEHPKEEEPR